MKTAPLGVKTKPLMSLPALRITQPRFSIPLTLSLLVCVAVVAAWSSGLRRTLTYVRATPGRW